MYVLSWQTVSVLNQVLFWYLFYQNNPLMSAETVGHSSASIILYESTKNFYHYHNNTKHNVIMYMFHGIYCDSSAWFHFDPSMDK